MRLIADSGSTCTDWHLITSKGQVEEYTTIGLNPYFVPTAEMMTAVDGGLSAKLDLAKVDEVFFYGAGCSSEEKCIQVNEALASVFANAKIEVNHDLMGAARAALGNSSGIVAILGTGSNSALYDGQEIVENIPSLGFVLGDEGSGAHMGKKLLKAYLSSQLGETISEQLKSEYNLTRERILDAIYSQPRPNTYLASFAKFIGDNRQDSQIDKLARSSINNFFERHICRYPGFEDQPLGFVGSIAHHFSDVIKDIANEKDIALGKIIVKPIGELVEYHR